LDDVPARGHIDQVLDFSSQQSEVNAAAMQIELDGNLPPGVQVIAKPNLSKGSFAKQALDSIARNLRRRNRSPKAQFL
jgi:hypothetical protein